MSAEAAKFAPRAGEFARRQVPRSVEDHLGSIAARGGLTISGRDDHSRPPKRGRAAVYQFSTGAGADRGRNMGGTEARRTALRRVRRAGSSPFPERAPTSSADRGAADAPRAPRDCRLWCPARLERSVGCHRQVRPHVSGRRGQYVGNIRGHRPRAFNRTNT